MDEIRFEKYANINNKYSHLHQSRTKLIINSEELIHLKLNIT